MIIAMIFWEQSILQRFLLLWRKQQWVSIIFHRSNIYEWTFNSQFTFMSTILNDYSWIDDILIKMSICASYNCVVLHNFHSQTIPHGFVFLMSELTILWLEWLRLMLLKRQFNLFFLCILDSLTILYNHLNSLQMLCQMDRTIYV